MLCVYSHENFMNFRSLIFTSLNFTGRQSYGRQSCSKVHLLTRCRGQQEPIKNLENLNYEQQPIVSIHKHWNQFCIIIISFNHRCAVHLYHKVLFDVEAADIEMVASALLVAIHLILRIKLRH